MNKIIRLVIGPVSVIVTLSLLLFAYLNKPAESSPPTNLEKLDKVQTRLGIYKPGLYRLFYVIPLEISAQSSPSDVHDFIEKSNSIHETIDQVKQTKVTITHTNTDSSLFNEMVPETHLWKSKMPDAWNLGRSICEFNVKNDGIYFFDVRKSALLNSPHCYFAVGIPSAVKESFDPKLTYFSLAMVLPFAFLAYSWAVLIATPWGKLADSYQSKCNYKKMTPVGPGAKLGKITSKLIPGKLFLLETAQGLELAIAGPMSMFGFPSILIPWDTIEMATRSGNDVVFTLKDPPASITIPVKNIKEAPKYISNFRVNTPNA